MKKPFLFFSCWLACQISVLAQEPPPLAITNFSLIGTQKVIKWNLFPAVKSYRILSSTNVGGPFTTNLGGTITGTTYTVTSSLPVNFFKFEVDALNSNELLTANVLNRLAYGPTPDDLELLLSTTNGAENFIASQLEPENIAETVNNSHTNIGFIEGKFASATDVIPENPLSYATIADFRAWHLLRAVGAKRQLLEVLLQFFENHFVTQFTKSTDYFDQFYDGGINEPQISAQFEYLENQKWREALLNTNCTFYNMLKISAESPAMIIYLDTVTSKGSGLNIANENYARELLELFTFGVDNGYTQSDILGESRAWTGWTVQIVSPDQASNPFTTRTTNLLASSIAVGATNVTTVSNLAGVWAFNFNSTSHDVSPSTRPKTMFTNAFIPARFGAPYATRFYGTNGVAGRYTLGFPARTGTNAIQDGYDIITYLANMPFTQEYICVKLCRLFVHDDFPNPSNDTNNSAYAFYNYAAGNLSPEGQLVRDCMTAWDNSNPKGQLRPVLQTIFNSQLFRSHGGSLHKVKTPLEYTVSAVRALRTSTNGTFMPGTYSADTDGRNLIAPILRMGNMSLFDRDAPDGYAEDAPYWISAGTLSERIRFIQSYCTYYNTSGHNGGDAGLNTFCWPGNLIIAKLPLASRTNAAAVVDYMMSIIYPGDGAGNLGQYRTAAINFLNDGSADSPSSATPFASLAVGGTATSAYDIRVRGMVSYLLSLQRFHEQ